MKLSLTRTSAGLVIRAKSVEVLAMQGERVISRVRVPIDGDTTSHLGQAIRQAIALSGLTRRKLAVAIPTDETLIRFFTTPMLPKAEWGTAIQFEAQKYTPFRTETLVWAYHAAESKTSHKLEVVFAAVQQQPFQELQTVLAEAGVQPTRIEPRSLSLARLTAPTQPNGSHPHEFVCLVDVEQEQAHLVIARGGVPHLARDVSLIEEAEDAAALASGGEAADSKAQRLLSELGVSMNFFTRTYPDARIPTVILVGEEALIEPWRQRLAEHLQCAVEVGRELLGHRDTVELPLSFASAVGLVRGGSQGLGVSMDFLKGGLAKSASTPLQEMLAPLITEFKSAHGMAMGAAAAGLLLLLWLFGAHQVRGQEARLSQLIHARPAVEWEFGATDLEHVKGVQETAKQQVELLKRVVDDRVGVVAKLDALARALPDGMWLTRVVFEETPDATGKSQVALRVSGACYLEQAGKELSAIRAFEDRIKKNPALFQGFSAARVDQIKEQVQSRNQTQYTYRTFLLDCRSDRKL